MLGCTVDISSLGQQESGDRLVAIVGSYVQRREARLRGHVGVVFILTEELVIIKRVFNVLVIVVEKRILIMEIFCKSHKKNHRNEWMKLREYVFENYYP